MKSQLPIRFIIYSLSISLIGCAGYDVDYVSTSENNINARLELVSGHILLRPHNQFAVGGSISIAYVPVIPYKEGHFSSPYYSKRGYYSDTQRDISFFIVEAFVLSSDYQTKIDVSSMYIDDGKNLVSPIGYWKTSEQGGETLCKDPRSVGQHLINSEPVTSLPLLIEAGYTLCLILKYPMAPIHPTKNFSFEIGKIWVDGRLMSKSRIDFVGTKNFEMTPMY